MMWPTWLTIQTQKCRSSGPPPPRRPPVLPSVIRFPFPPTDLRPRSVPSDPTSWIECGRKEGERGSGRSPSERAREEERESHSTANGAGGRRWERKRQGGRGRTRRTEGIRQAFWQPDDDNPATHVERTNINKSEVYPHRRRVFQSF